MTTTKKALTNLSIAAGKLKRCVVESMAELFRLEKVLDSVSRVLPVEPVDVKQCPTCHGSKTVEVHETISGSKEQNRVFMEPCEDCNATGSVNEYTKSVYEI